jgi:CheY-like chemotaxis protein
VTDLGYQKNAQNLDLFTTKADGSGLGLCVSNDIVIGHDGEIRVESEWGKGTSFIIALPVIEVEYEKEREERVKKNLKGTKGLVIDDEPSFTDSVRKYLEFHGCEIMMATDAKTALNIIENRDFDFVICDIKMQEMDGIELYNIIKEKKPSIKDRIIFSTGDVLSDRTRAFLDSITNLTIEKPFDLIELKRVITSILL